jgi:hypothetical protein
MLFEYILAVVFLLSPQTRPELISPMPDKETCMAQAEQFNKTNETLRTEEARSLGAEFVCLKIERVNI